MKKTPRLHESLQEIVALAQRRVERAKERVELAKLEEADALLALSRATARLARWHDDNPDPQLSLV